jgi:signal transduction histidine kinase
VDSKPTYEKLQQRVKQLEKEAGECKGELEDTSRELALGLSEVSQALRQIASGDPHVRMPETAKLELIVELKHMVNLTAENLAEMVNLSHEFAIGLAEHFDALHRVSTGDLTARVSGISQVDILESLKKVTNQMIESVSTQITERQRAEKALRNAHNEMEQRVEERTAQLSQANEELEAEINERKNAEEALTKVHVELKGFLDVVAHDLKNPILGIQGFSVLLLKKYQEELGEKGRKYVHQIDASARQMSRLVSDLLSLSRVGQVASNFKYVASREIVKNLSTSLQNRLEENGIELVVRDNLPTIYCDARRIYQVFENLLVNAAKFTGGAERPRIEIGCKDSGGSHQFYVRDNGIGIDPKYHQKIFEMFRRLKQTEDEEGTGLGLAIVDRIVKNHGGKVWVESERGGGAIFYFTLPKAS